MAAERRQGIEGSLAVLRQELECMQKQDKELYKQLLHLQDTIRGLKVELKREREECEEAFRDLQEISPDGEPDSILSEDDQIPKQSLLTRHSDVEAKESKRVGGKHERQDSGISVRHCCSEIELTNNANGISVKPMLIQHSKQDSGILIDEEAMKETKFLSRLVQSSPRVFTKTEDKKIRYSPSSSHSSRCEQVDTNETLLPPPQYCRSKSINDLYSEKPFRSFRDPNSATVAKHERTRSCPATSVRKLPLSPADSPYKVIACHQVRPKKRSASVVDLTRLAETNQEDLHKERNPENTVITKDGTKRQAAQLVNGTDVKEMPLKAVFVCANEVRVSSTHQQQNTKILVRTCGGARTETGPQRRATVIGTRPNRQYFQDGGFLRQNERTATISNSQSFQYPRYMNHSRHRTTPENMTPRRRHSMMHIWHASSKSWDGNEGRLPSQHITNLFRSASQVSLV